MSNYYGSHRSSSTRNPSRGSVLISDNKRDYISASPKIYETKTYSKPPMKTWSDNYSYSEKRITPRTNATDSIVRSDYVSSFDKEISLGKLNDRIESLFLVMSRIEGRIGTIEDKLDTRSQINQKPITELMLNKFMETLNTSILQMEQRLYQTEETQRQLISQHLITLNTRFDQLNSEFKRSMEGITKQNVSFINEMKQILINPHTIENRSPSNNVNIQTNQNGPISDSANRTRSDNNLQHSVQNRSDKARAQTNALLPSKLKVSDFNSKDRRSTPGPTTPRGFDNPAGYCYLNCVIQLLRGCREFSRLAINYHSTSEIKNSKSGVTENNFVSDFCELFEQLDKKDNKRIKIFVRKIQFYFESTSCGDDVMQCFMKVLTKLHDVISIRPNFSRMGSLSGMTADEAFKTYETRHNGFVFDSFYGQLSHATICDSCKYCIRESFQLFKTMSLPVPILPNTTLEDCFECFFRPSPVETDDTEQKKICKCKSSYLSKIVSVTKITHAPKYLFVYLNRGSYVANGSKNNTFVNCKETLTVQTSQSTICYELISVVDHLGDNEGGHYYVKSCFEGNLWYIVNDSQVAKCGQSESIVTKNTIVFMFKKLE